MIRRSGKIANLVKWPSLMTSSAYCRTDIFRTRFFPRFSENEVFAQCYFHDFRFICSLSLVIFQFGAVLFFLNREKRENITGVKKTPSTVGYVVTHFNLVAETCWLGHWVWPVTTRYLFRYCKWPFSRGHHIFPVFAVGIQSAKISRPRFRTSYRSNRAK